MKVYIASDHAGFDIKEKVKAWVKALGFDLVDMGPNNDDRVNYPDFAAKLCQSVKTETKSRGILI